MLTQAAPTEEEKLAGHTGHGTKLMTKTSSVVHYAAE